MLCVPSALEQDLGSRWQRISRRRSDQKTRTLCLPQRCRYNPIHQAPVPNHTGNLGHARPVHTYSVLVSEVMSERFAPAPHRPAHALLENQQGPCRSKPQAAICVLEYLST